MTAYITAVDKDSSDGFTRTFHFETKEEFQEQWKQFEKDVPFSRWYPDFDAEDEETAEKIEEWVS